MLARRIAMTIPRSSHTQNMCEVQSGQLTDEELKKRFGEIELLQALASCH